MTSNGRLPQILKVQYLSKYWSDLPHILNLFLCDQSKLYKCFKRRRPSIEDNLYWKNTLSIKSEISLQLLVRSSPNFKLKLLGPNFTDVSNEDDLQ